RPRRGGDVHAGGGPRRLYRRGGAAHRGPRGPPVGPGDPGGEPPGAAPDVEDTAGARDMQPRIPDDRLVSRAEQHGLKLAGVIVGRPAVEPADPHRAHGFDPRGGVVGLPHAPYYALRRSVWQPGMSVARPWWPFMLASGTWAGPARLPSRLLGCL